MALVILNVHSVWFFYNFFKFYCAVADIYPVSETFGSKNM